MKLAKNWKIKTETDMRLVLESTTEYLQIKFNKENKTYQLWVDIDEEYYEEQYPILLNLDEHKMICSIVQELWG